MHFELCEFADLHDFLQQLTHIVQMRQRSCCTLVTLAAVEHLSCFGEPVVQAEGFLIRAINELLAQFHHFLLSFSWNAEIGLDRNA